MPVAPWADALLTRGPAQADPGQYLEQGHRTPSPGAGPSLAGRDQWAPEAGRTDPPPSLLRFSEAFGARICRWRGPSLEGGRQEGGAGAGWHGLSCELVFEKRET